MDAQGIVSIVLAGIALFLGGYIGCFTPILRQAGPTTPRSFSRFQLWLWTMVIAGAFALNWGFYRTDPKAPPLQIPNINQTGWILLAISAGALITSGIVDGVLKNEKENKKAKGEKMTLKEDQTSVSFWIDILSDTKGNLSIPRLQNLIFTFIYIGVYITMFFTNKGKYPDFDATAYLLMGISTAGYIVGKAQSK